MSVSEDTPPHIRGVLGFKRKGNHVPKAQYKLAKGVVLERVGDQVLAKVPAQTRVIWVSSDAVSALEGLIQGSEYATADQAIASDLVQAGILSPRANQLGVSRRGLLKAGGVGVATGITIMALPAAASAASGFVLVNLLGAILYQIEATAYFVSNDDTFNEEAAEDIFSAFGISDFDPNEDRAWFYLISVDPTEPVDGSVPWVENLSIDEDGFTRGTVTFAGVIYPAAYDSGTWLFYAGEQGLVLNVVGQQVAPGLDALDGTGEFDLEFQGKDGAQYRVTEGLSINP
jgi:hypothetical protein